MEQSERRLALETQAAQAMRSVLETMTDDPEAIRDTLEGMTDLREMIAAVFGQITEDELLATGLGVMIETMNARRQRIEHRMERRRAAIERAMIVGEIPKVELPEATISTRRVPPALQISDEGKIPERFWVPQPHKLDRAALKEALKARDKIPGASLSNGSVSLTIRRA